MPSLFGITLFILYNPKGRTRRLTDRARTSELPAFTTFVRGIRADYTEEHINRLKFINRQGYDGCASFDLLKRRGLPLTT
jgi:hypothetical protein